ncbi:hypothetical protein PSM7751_00809 [Pseudooceanicola marinus]|uniref:Retroviral aspartyl protease n=1 Tax=Pseudooceanicola marinus TaxID=396013 RepID=A0A1X6YKS4_9RHOB|nr:TIGR02281 family clan AA aspartic protease [Pseudooceanicola marinus]PJE29615.1 TIGR02281 family clan AA aspartic protease [Pseudooceanicola marinus]SLN24173.1 hypothetical protein PSM7751_00809 [Pseudooceanicola marinus]
MSSIDIGNLAYLGLMLAAIGGYFFVSNRDRIGQMARHAVLWALIFVAVIAGIGLWDQVRTTIRPAQTVAESGRQITLPQQADGHYYARLEVNGEPMTFLVDTGATDVVLTREAARAAGIDMDRLIYSGRAGTANGTVRTAPVRLESVTLGGVTDRDVRAMVNEGEQDMPLLGMSYLSRFSHIEIAGGALRLTR